MSLTSPNRPRQQVLMLDSLQEVCISAPAVSECHGFQFQVSVLRLTLLWREIAAVQVAR